MLIKEMTDQHLINAIRYWKRRLAEKPTPQVYMGNSDYGEDWVEQENIQNEMIAQAIVNRIQALNNELSLRNKVCSH